MLDGQKEVEVCTGYLDEGAAAFGWDDGKAVVEVRDEEILQVPVGLRVVGDAVKAELLG